MYIDLKHDVGLRCKHTNHNFNCIPSLIYIDLKTRGKCTLQTCKQHHLTAYVAYFFYLD